jgi:7-carboxy-7-deazaguanine synthase
MAVANPINPEIQEPTLRITEIFYSLQGETRTVGWPTVFVRLTGCPLRCQYCDSAYAFHGGKRIALSDILSSVAAYTPRFVTVTGGEPLAQKDCIPLLKALCDQNYQVSLETSGAIDVSAVDARVIKVLDLKTPGSQEEQKNLYSNLDFITQRDQRKFVICDRKDYEWAKEIVDRYDLGQLCEVLFSPSAGQQSESELADWILSDRLYVRFQIQLHKKLWGDVPGR